MKNFFVIANKGKEETTQLKKDIKDYLMAHGANCTYDDGPDVAVKKGYTNPDSVPENTECVIVLGGDGTMLKAAFDLIDRGIPFLGINMGNLGYLASVEKADTYKALDQMLADDYIIEQRMMVYGAVKVDGKIVEEPRALNEIVIKGKGTMQVSYLDVFVNGLYLHKYQGDGIIVATPTGSTGYSLSAGGPIVSPTAQMIIMTPVCSHSMQNRGVVFSSEDTIEIVIDEGRYGTDQEVIALFDAANRIPMKSGDSITIKKSEKITKIVKLKEESFLETLHNKLEG